MEKIPETYLYIFQLGNSDFPSGNSEKYFLHSSQSNNELRSIIELQMQNRFVNKYLPIKLQTTIPIYDTLEIDKIVKQYMLKFGVDNVRGGDYTEEFLPDYKTRLLNQEFNGTVKKNIYFNTFNTIIEKYSNSDLTNIEYLNNEIARLETDYDNYKNTVKRYEYVKYFKLGDAVISLGRHNIENLSWLTNFCGIEVTSDDKVSASTIINYNKILVTFKQIRKIYNFLKDEKLVDPNAIYVDNPEFIFDDFFYHRTNIKDWEKTYEKALCVVKLFTLMTYYIVNRLEELEFDILSFSKDIKLERQIAIDFLNYWKKMATDKNEMKNLIMSQIIKTLNLYHLTAE